MRDGGVRDAELFPVRAVFGIGTAEMREEAMREAADREERLGEPGGEQFVRRSVADEIGGVAEKREARCAGEELRFGEVYFGAVGELQIMREGEIFAVRGKVGHEFGHLTAENECAGRIAEFEAVGVAPAGEPFEEGSAGDVNEIAAFVGFRVEVGDPLDAIPIGGGEKFLLVRGAGAEVEQFGNAALFFAGARAIDVEFEFEMEERAGFTIRFALGDGFGSADDAHGGAGGVEVELLGREKPFLELRDEFFLLLGGFDFGETFEVGVGHQLAGERAIVFEEEEGGFLESGFAGDGEHAGPPGGAREIFAGEREFLEIVFEEEEGALGIAAVGEDVQEVGALGDGGF